MNNKVAIITVATGKYYDKFIPNLYESIKKFIKFDNDFICFTDNLNLTEFKKIKVDHEAWPHSTLSRYKNIVKNKNIFEPYSHVLYLDSDMVIVDDLDYNIMSDLIGVVHPGFASVISLKFSYERNPISSAFIPYGMGETYYQGCVQGGKKEKFIEMSEDLVLNIEKDLAINYIAKWYDESHLNKYFLENKPTTILDPDYAWPSEYVGKSYCGTSYTKAKILHLEKQKELRD